MALKSVFLLILLSVFVTNAHGRAMTDELLADFLVDMIDEGVEEFEGMERADFAMRLSLIYPGTKWCGTGSTAENYDDLGSERETDMCCRDHDNCPDWIPGGETKYNLTNEAFYSRMQCDCDETFRQCLRTAYKETESKAARNIGFLYFNALQTQCFRYDYPVVRCVKYGGWLDNRCLKYEFDTNGQQRYQWFDVRTF